MSQYHINLLEILQLDIVKLKEDIENVRLSSMSNRDKNKKKK